MSKEDNLRYSNSNETSPKNFLTSTPKSTNNSHRCQGNLESEVQQGSMPSPQQVQDVLQNLPNVLQLLQTQSGLIPNGGQDTGTERLSFNLSGQEPLIQELRHWAPQQQGPTDRREYEAGLCDGSINQQTTREPQINSIYQTRNRYSNSVQGNRPPCAEGGDNPIPPTKSPKVSKEGKSITTKTFAKGMMDVSLLTSNATQLRSVMSHPSHEFHDLLLGLITLSVLLQITSSVLLIVSDFYKTQIKELDRQYQRKRKILNFISLALITMVTSLNVLISAFYSPGMEGPRQQQNNVPQFSPASYMTSQHSEL